MEQVIRRKIPIRIKNVENPRGGGTVIHPDLDADVTGTYSGSLDGSDNADSDISQGYLLGLGAPEHSPPRRRKSPTAVTIKERIVVLNVSSNRKSVSHGFLAGIFGTLDRYGVVVDLISTSEVYVCIRAEDVILVKGSDRPSSARNHLPAIVQSLTREGPLMRVELSCGFNLTALLTKRACEEMLLKSGDQVVALVKAPHIHLIPR